VCLGGLVVFSFAGRVTAPDPRPWRVIFVNVHKWPGCMFCEPRP
jgi:hypothetical protein